MPERLVLVQNKSFINTLARTDLAERFLAKGFRTIPVEHFNPPFSFSPDAVFGLIPQQGVGIIGEETFARFPNLKVASPFGVGVDHFDRKAAAARGIHVVNCPRVSSRDVAELAAAMMFGLARNIARYDRDMKSDRWNRIFGVRLVGKTLGIIGLGNIGKQMADIGLGLGMQVIANDIVYDEAFLAAHPGVKRASFDEIITKSDVISLHVPLTPLTQQFINRAVFEHMKQGILFVNAARSEVVDIPALIDALDSGKVAGTAIDPFPEEPPFHLSDFKRLIQHERVIASPHIGAYTPEAHYAVGERVLLNMDAIASERLGDAAIISGEF